MAFGKAANESVLLATDIVCYRHGSYRVTHTERGLNIRSSTILRILTFALIWLHHVHKTAHHSGVVCICSDRDPSGGLTPVVDPFHDSSFHGNQPVRRPWFQNSHIAPPHGLYDLAPIVPRFPPAQQVRLLQAVNRDDPCLFFTLVSAVADC